VTGPGSTWTSNGVLFVADAGTGALTVRNGGMVSDVTGLIAGLSGSSGTVTVSDPGSTWTNSGDLFVGGGGTGTLTIQNNGLVQTGGTVFIANSGGTGTIEALDGTIQTVGGITVLGVGTVSLDHSTLTANSGDANAFLVENGGDANIFISNVNDTIHAGSGNLLDVIGSTATLTAMNLTLSGDILADAATKSANVFLEHNSALTGAINENTLTGATGINPTEQITHPIAPGLPPFTVNLGIDSTSTWNMSASSTLNTLTVDAQAHINFADPPAGAFKTLLINNLVGTGGIFRENNDLAAIKGDLIEILTKSEGVHLLTFNNRTAGSDLPVNTALLVVRTPDGGAAFTGQEDGGTFRYFVVHGDGSSVTPVRNDWYLVRGGMRLRRPKLRLLLLPIPIQLRHPP
jgi:T5SS/PEP-CTERM-associated repeat protein